MLPQLAHRPGKTADEEIELVMQSKGVGVEAPSSFNVLRGALAVGEAGWAVSMALPGREPTEAGIIRRRTTYGDD